MLPLEKTGNSRTRKIFRCLINHLERSERGKKYPQLASVSVKGRSSSALVAMALRDCAQNGQYD